MTRLAQTTFALLVCFTLGAFLLTQRLKRAPLVVRQHTVSDEFSPLHHRASIRFSLRRSDEGTVTILNGESEPVRYLARGRHLPGHGVLQFFWDGRTSSGRIVPDGRYYVRITLRHQGRSVTLRRGIRVDSTGPRPVLWIDSPSGAGPAVIPQSGRDGRREVSFHFSGAALAPRFRVYRNDVVPRRLVAELPGTEGSNSGRWNGTDNAGRPVPPGDYFVSVRVSDSVHNVGNSPPLRGLGRKEKPGRPGVTVRYLAARGPLEPAVAGYPVDLSVDARGRRYSWRLVSLAGGAPLARGAAAAPALRLVPPKGAAGLALVEISAPPDRFTVPLVVQPASYHPVLVVFPAISWQGRNRSDDDGDGQPNTLEHHGPASLARPLAGGGLPVGFPAQEEPLLRFLDGARLRYDATTDVALVRGHGPPLEGHRGVVLAGEQRWVPAALQAALRRYVVGGGNVLLLGTDSLRRGVRLSADRLVQASDRQPTDAFGASPGPLVDRRVDLLAFGDDSIGLFAGTGGLFSGFDSFEPAGSLGAGTRVLAAAGEQEGDPVIVAYRLGKGLVIRTGLPQWSSRLSVDSNVQTLTRRAWSLLSQ